MRALLIVIVLSLAAALCLPSSLTAQEREEINEITLEMTQGIDSSGHYYGRAYKITLRRDGAALYDGKANVKLTGHFQGTIDAAEFQRLSEFLLSQNYSQIKSYLLASVGTRTGAINSPAMMTPLVITSVKEGKKQKTIKRAANETLGVNENAESLSKVPQSLFEIETAITRAAQAVKWAKVGK